MHHPCKTELPDLQGGSVHASYIVCVSHQGGKKQLAVCIYQAEHQGCSDIAGKHIAEL